MRWQQSDLVTHRYFGTDSALFLGPLPPATVHSHHAIQGCFALEERLRVDVGAQGTAFTTAALIAADVPHAVSASGMVAHFYALPESAAGSRLVEALSGRRVIHLESGSTAGMRCFLLEAMADERLFPQCLERLMHLALHGAPPEPRRDPRVSDVLDTLRFGSPDTPLTVLARGAGLSPERLRHLIRNHAGIPLRQYRRWARLLGAIEALRDTGSVTAAAHAAGFADAAHLSRVFREAFAFPPSAFLKNSRFVQARGDGPA